MSGRMLSDDDVKAIVAELKAQIFKDFQLEVGRGVVGWVKKAFVLLLIILALYGLTGGKGWFSRAAARVIPRESGISATLGAVALRAAGMRPTGFTVIPPHDTPEDMLAMAEQIDRLNSKRAA